MLYTVTCLKFKPRLIVDTITPSLPLVHMHLCWFLDHSNLMDGTMICNCQNSFFALGTLKSILDAFGFSFRNMYLIHCKFSNHGYKCKISIQLHIIFHHSKVVANIMQK